MPPRPARLMVLDGLTPYDEAHALQLETVKQRINGEVPDTLYLLEHPPVITLGRNAAESGVVASGELLASQGIGVHRIERGGEATYHGPGQIVGYPIFELAGLGLGVREYVSGLEEVMIRTAASLGMEANRREKTIGIFTPRGKLGAIGVRVRKGVSFHGFAFNVAPDLAHYRLIVPCGMTDTPVTSLAAILGDDGPDMDRARQVIADSFSSVFGVSFQ